MKNTLKVTMVVVVALVLSLAVLAQDRGARPASGDSGSSSSSIASRGVASSSTSTSSVSSSSSSRDYSSSSGSYVPGNSGYSSGSARNSSSMGTGGYVPDFRTSSFNSLGYYYQYQDFFYYLQMHYYMNGNYFSRFYRNREPLITPELLKLTVRQPLRLSTRLLSAVDELDMMVKERANGKPIDNQAIANKTQEIRELAKTIRQDQSLAFFDQRREKDPLKGIQTDGLGIEAISQLREMATDLNSQLKSMYSDARPSTVSVQSLSAPSFESLTKGIDKLSRVIENSARKI